MDAFLLVGTNPPLEGCLGPSERVVDCDNDEMELFFSIIVPFGDVVALRLCMFPSMMEGRGNEAVGLGDAVKRGNRELPTCLNGSLAESPCLVKKRERLTETLSDDISERWRGLINAVIYHSTLRGGSSLVMFVCGGAEEKSSARSE